MKFDLVFEGGGAKGMVFIGALKEIEERGHAYGRLMGTSAGAIMATFLAAGYSAAEMAEVLNERVDGKPAFVQFMGAPESFDTDVIRASVTREWLQEADLPLLRGELEDRVDDWIVDTLLESALYRHIFSFVERGGWYSADAFLVWLRSKLDEGTFNGQPRQFGSMTLAEFYEATGADLTLLAADISGGRLLVLNHRTAPQLPLAWAVRMSMSIPLLWQEVIWQPSWGSYRDKDISGNAVVDGGLLSNFPIELFITEEPMWTAVMGPKMDTVLLGMLIDEGIAVPGAPSEQDGAEGAATELRTVNRLKALVETVTQARDKGVISAYKQFVIRLPAKGYGTTEFDMSDERRDALVDAGQAFTKQYFDQMGELLPTTSPAFEVIGFYDQADEVAARLLAD